MQHHRDVDSLVELVFQSRSFSVLTLPKEKTEANLSVDESELLSFYEANQEQYSDPEKVRVSYIELSLTELASSIEINEDDLVDEYNRAIEDVQVGEELNIAHILVYADDNDVHDQKVNDVLAGIESGTEFGVLAAEFSDDRFTKSNGGELGIHDPETFSDAFNEAVNELNEGEISPPVESEFGTHFVKLLSKTNREAPSLDDMRFDLEARLREAQAQNIYLEKLELMKELAYSAPDLNSPAEQLNLNIQQSDFFSKDFGAGVASAAEVRDAAFSTEVKTEKYNSDVIELEGSRAVVVYVEEITEAQVKPFTLVQAEVLESLKANKLEEAFVAESERLKRILSEGVDIASLSDEFEVQSYNAIRSNDAIISPEVIRFVFAMTHDQDVVRDGFVSQGGDYLFVELTDSRLGSLSGLPEQTASLLSSQRRVQNNRGESAAYSAAVLESAKVKIYN